MVKQKWGKIGAPGSARRKAHMRAISKGRNKTKTAQASFKTTFKKQKVITKRRHGYKVKAHTQRYHTKR